MKPLHRAAAQISTIMRRFIATPGLALYCQILTHPGHIPDLSIDFFGRDTRLLVLNDRELLDALRHLSVQFRAPRYPGLLACNIVEPELVALA